MVGIGDLSWYLVAIRIADSYQIYKIAIWSVSDSYLVAIYHHGYRTFHGDRPARTVVQFGWFRATGLSGYEDDEPPVHPRPQSPSEKELSDISRL
jgi:hypothetical protein